MTQAATDLEPVLPSAVGPVSHALINHLAGRSPRRYYMPVEAPVGDSHPLALDSQLALYVCYELHYRGFADVDARWEWDPGVLQFRGRLEQTFLNEMHRQVGDLSGIAAADEMDRLATEPVSGNGPSYFLRDDGDWHHMREYFIHRSIYHLKEGDPHAWAIPRLTGAAKAAFVAVEFDEFGGGRADHGHQQLFADLMVAAGLDATYLHYLDDVPAEALAAVNLMSLFGLHRHLRGAAVGHFAATEITSSPGSRRLVEALTRLEAPEPCVRFYREHVEDDAVHEQIVRTDVVGDLVAREPQLELKWCWGFELSSGSRTGWPSTSWLAGSRSPVHSAARSADRRALRRWLVSHSG